MANQLEKLTDLIVNHYLESGDFNGLGVSVATKEDCALSDVELLIRSRRIDLVRGDGHPNPHIKAFDAEPVEVQIEKLNANGLAGCFYPTAEILNEIGAGKVEKAPYTQELMQGSPQLSFRVFDLRALEWYRNDPRFEYQVDDIHGRIMQRAGTQIGDRNVVQDELEFFEFGFAYDSNMNRAVAAFVRYLHDLPAELQLEIKKHQVQGDYKLHPDFFRTQIMGDFPERLPICDAILEEKKQINIMCDLMKKPSLFRTTFKDNERPHGFGLLIRPTRREYDSFALQLDQLLSDDIQTKFFKGDLETVKKLTDEEGKTVHLPKGTILLLEEWITTKFKPADPKPIEEMFANFRFVRKERQKPAHRPEDNEFDQKFLADQRTLLIAAYDAVHTLRMILENHPMVKTYEVPQYIREAKVWTY